MENGERNEVLDEALVFLKYLEAEGWVSSEWSLFKEDGEDLLHIGGITEEGDMTIYRLWVVLPDELAGVQLAINDQKKAH